MLKQKESLGDSKPAVDSIDAQARIRDELHSLQVGLNLLRIEMLTGDFLNADLTYATLQQCLNRLSTDPMLAAAVSNRGVLASAQLPSRS